MTKEDSMLEDAVKMFGVCIESEACEAMVASMLMKEYDISEKDAKAIARLARVEWVEAYS
jgi:hypothetical protein